jgi:hypothetical protein
MKIGMIAITLMVSAFCGAQPEIKLYGFSQVSTPGMVPQRDFSVPGEKPWKAVITYYLYLSLNPSARIQPREIWIEGKRFAVTSSVVHAPVKSPSGVTLVPHSKFKIIELHKKDSLPALNAPSLKLKKLIRENDLVVYYSWQGRKYYRVLKEIRELEPVYGE